MNENARCSSCGAELLQDAASQGVCPACLLKLGLSSTNIPPVEPLEPQHHSPPPHRRKIGWIVIAATLVALGAATLLLFFPRPSAAPQFGVIRFSLALDNAADFAVSPDGRRIAFTATNADGKKLLWIHSFDAFIDTPFTDTEGAASPFWSPDSRLIGFFAKGKLKRLDISTGAPETLCDAPAGRNGAWSSSGVIVFSQNSGGLYRVSDRGGSPESATVIDRSEREGISHRWPYFLPDGRHFLYTAVSNNADKDGIFLFSLDSGESKRIMNGRSPTAFAEESLLFVSNGLLLVQPFDFKRQRTSGDARPLRFAENIDQFSTSNNRLLAYRTKVEPRASPLAWLDRSGKILKSVDVDSGAGDFAISPDGRMIAVVRSGDVWLMDVSRGVTSRFTFDPAEDTSPIWSPDGSRVVFVSNRGGRRGLYQKAVHSGTAEEPLLMGNPVESVESWSPDGRFIAYTSRDDKLKSTVWLLPLEGDRKPFMIQSAFNIREPRFSPDRRWLAYVSDESGKDEVYVESFPPGQSKFLVSTEGGTMPQWSRDGRELFYISPARMLMSVAFSGRVSGAELRAPAALLQAPSGSYNVSPDGATFLMTLRHEDERHRTIDVVINWPSELASGQ